LFCKSNPQIIGNKSFEKFLEYYPGLDKRERKTEYQRQMTELFFNQCSKELEMK